MRPTVEDGLRALSEATDLSRQLRVELSAEYIRLIERVEALPQNRSGAEKSNRWLGSRRHRDLFSRGHFLPRRL